MTDSLRGLSDKDLVGQFEREVFLDGQGSATANSSPCKARLLSRLSRLEALEQVRDAAEEVLIECSTQNDGHPRITEEAAHHKLELALAKCPPTERGTG